MRSFTPTHAGSEVVRGFLAFVALLTIAMAGSARAELLPYTGTFEFQIAETVYGVGVLGDISIPVSGFADASLLGQNHLASLALPAGAVGPLSVSLPITSMGTINSVIFTSLGNLTGSFPAISGGPPGGGTMGLSGTAKICLVFAPCVYAFVPIPLPPTPGGAGLGIGGTATTTAPGPVAVTMQHNPWALGPLTMTYHALSTTTKTLAVSGFAHGPASVTSSTAADGGELQLVTVSRAYTSLTTGFPGFSLSARLRLAFAGDACDDGVDNDGDGLVDWPDDPGCDDSEDPSEQSSALVCDNGLDDDGDTLVDVADDPGCDDPGDPSEHNPAVDCDDGSDDDGDELIDWPHDPGCEDAEDESEQSPSLVCDNGLDDDGDGLVDVAEDPGCDDPNDSSEHTDAIDCDDGADNDDDGLVDILDPGCDDPFEQNCGQVSPLTDNGTEDAAPAVSESRIAWQQWEAGDPEVLLWDGSSVTALTDNALWDLSPSIAGSMVVWEEWGGSDARVMRWTGSSAVPLSDPGVDAWSPHTDGSGVVWSQGPESYLPPEGVYHWDGSGTTRIFGSAGGVAPAISGERIVWETDAGIHMWTGSATVLIPGSAGGHAPAISGQKVVWHASDGSDDEIYLWDDSTTQPLTDNASDDRNADISGNRVVWESAEGIQVWTSGGTSLVAGSLGGQLPKVDGIDVVWKATDGSDNEIVLTKLCVACNDGDAKIDYDGGFSALGYVATEADPQCRNKPWKKAETAYSPCGLGTELALLLPPLLWLHRRRGRRSL